MARSAQRNPSTDEYAGSTAPVKKVTIAEIVQQAMAQDSKEGPRYGATQVEGANEGATAAFVEERKDKEAAVAAMYNMSRFLAEIGLADEFKAWVDAGIQINGEGEFEPDDSPQTMQARAKIAADVRMRISPSMT